MLICVWRIDCGISVVLELNHIELRYGLRGHRPNVSSTRTCMLLENNNNIDSASELLEIHLLALVFCLFGKI